MVCSVVLDYQDSECSTKRSNRHCFQFHFLNIGALGHVGGRRHPDGEKSGDEGGDS